MTSTVNYFVVSGFEETDIHLNFNLIIFLIYWLNQQTRELKLNKFDVLNFTLWWVLAQHPLSETMRCPGFGHAGIIN